MKTIWAILLACSICSCGHKPVDNTLTVWQIPNTDGASLEISYTAISEAQLAKILEKGSQGDYGISLNLCLSPGVGISNAVGPLALAEKYGITNITLRLDQIRPPNTHTNDPDIMYEGQK